MTAGVERDPDEADDRQQSWAHLTVLSSTLGPDELTTLAGVAPNEAWRKGDRGRRGRPVGSRGMPFNGIVVGSRLSRDSRPEAHLNDVVAQLDAGRIRGLRADARIDSVRLWLVVYTTRDNPAVSLEPHELNAITLLGTGIDVDIYIVDHEWFERAGEWQLR